MPTYLSPGVYVEEIPSGLSPIAGVGTSTAGFIGVLSSSGTTYDQNLEAIAGEQVGTGDGTQTSFILSQYPVATVSDTFSVTVGGEAATATLSNDNGNQQSVVTFDTAPASGAIVIDYQPVFQSVKAGEVKLCTNFTEFKQSFGDFSSNSGQNTLAHAVYGFFRNGGTRCYVVWVTQESDIRNALESFEVIDEIALVAAPGVTTKSALGDIDAHCRNLGDRFAIFDSAEEVTDLGSLKPGEGEMPFSSDYAGYYFPWIQVFDPGSNSNIYIPPSGHIAGVYARVDTQRGVFKAPGNEAISGAIGLKYSISKSKQAGLNPQGINCIRNLNGNILVWGARTLGGDANGEFKYISTRRLFNFLRESIDEGTQWTVFEPNSPELWARIRRNVTAFLTTVWQSGALFGNTPEQAFYVKCDEENNPPNVRELGQVIIEIGVAVVKPAEFVIFRISQWQSE